jgi:PAS domain S-box-containing protein
MTDRGPAGSTPAGLEDVASADQFRLFLRWLAVVAFASALIVAVGAAWFSDARLWVTAAALFFGGLNALAAGRLAAAGRARAGVELLLVGVLLIGTTMTLCLPDVDAIPVAAAVVGAIVALPYLSGVPLRRVFLVIFAWSAMLSVLREVVPFHPQLPSGFVHGLEVATMLAFVGLTLLLLWHFRERLLDLVTKTREAELKYRTLVEEIPAVTYVWEVVEEPSEGAHQYTSPQIQAMLGYTPREWEEDPNFWIGCIHPEDRETVLETAGRSEASGDPFQIEYRYVAKDGRTVWVRDEAVLMTRRDDGRPWLFQGVMVDITARKHAEEELHESFELLRRTDAERRRLLGELVSAQEEERTRLAAAIHDDPVQKMTAVALRLQMLRGKLSDREDVAALEQLEGTVELAIARLRSLLFELRPPSLDRAGLADTIREYVSYANGQLPECGLDNQLVSEPSDETRTVAYRIAVEALSNVQRHAHAQHVEVMLVERDGGLSLRIRDDGVGIPPDLLAGEGRHVGLSSIRERAEMAGGWGRIESRPGTGTTIEAWLPMDASRSA